MPTSMKDGMPNFKEFLLWLDKTPNAKEEFRAFCTKYKLHSMGWEEWEDVHKDYACRIGPYTPIGASPAERRLASLMGDGMTGAEQGYYSRAYGD